jgi:orotate phosphoribosyltransferase
MDFAAMVEKLLTLMAARRGHFLLESGHHGELWLDVDRLFVWPEQLRPFVVELAERLAPHAIDAVCGPLTGGAFLAQMVAETMGVPFVYADRVAPPPGWHVPSPRRAWSAPRHESTTPSEDAELATQNPPSSELFPVDYPIPPELAEFVRNKRVAVVNDVINAGSAVRGAIASLRACDAQPTVIGALLILGDFAAALASAADVSLESLHAIPNPIWEPASCPLCQAGRPLQDPAAC